ncbi:hypothetical protein [Bacillus wiedmannii]|uniref:hypothetical protein n=1 Tax=Bacillus wiedmannii TaxID=1890302 RepID=UPI001484CAAE|nr:hypothetical protein [Bacillus wiedmannii]
MRKNSRLHAVRRNLNGVSLGSQVAAHVQSSSQGQQIQPPQGFQKKSGCGCKRNG